MRPVDCTPLKNTRNWERGLASPCAIWKYAELGNLLGTQQSGHIATVGYELYCQLLEGAVRQLTRQPPKIKIDVEVNLPIEAFLSSEYIPEMRHKIDVYRRLSRLQDVHAIAELRQELADRFGPLPEIAARLLDVAELRMDAALWSIRYIGVEDDYVAFTFSDAKRIEQLAQAQRKIAHRGWPTRVLATPSGSRKTSKYTTVFAYSTIEDFATDTSRRDQRPGRSKNQLTRNAKVCPEPRRVVPGQRIVRRQLVRRIQIFVPIRGQQPRKQSETIRHSLRFAIEFLALRNKRLHPSR